MTSPKSITKHDVALAEVHRKASREIILVRGAAIALGILASTLPIYALQGVVEPLAGQTTTVDVNVVVSITLAMSLVVNGLQFIKGRSRRRELRRQRVRLKTFEEGAK